VENEAIVAADLRDRLHRLGYVVAEVCATAEQALQKIASTSIDLILMEVQPPGKVDGLATARIIREQFNIPVVYLIANADPQTFQRANSTKPFSYLAQPFDERMMEINIEVALHTHALEQENGKLSKQLNEALSQVKTLSGLLPICSGCKKIQDQKGYWTRFEVYIENHSAATFMHGICPDCRQGLQNEVETQMHKDVKGIPRTRL